MGNSWSQSHRITWHRLVRAVFCAIILLNCPRSSHAFEIHPRSEDSNAFATPLEIALFPSLQLAGGPVYGIRLNVLWASNPSLTGLDIGVGLNSIGDSSEGIGRVTGLQVAGLANSVACDTKGIQVAGLINATGENLRGIQLALLGNFAGNANGIQLAGLTNLSGAFFEHHPKSEGPSTAFQVSLLANVGHVTGVQVGGWNASSGSALQVGVANIGGYGMQFGFWNTGPDPQPYRGLQVGVVNAAEGGIEGVQVGAIQVLGFPYGYGGKFDAMYSRGVQLGLFCKSNAFQGLQACLVNMSNNLRGIQVGLYNQANNARIRTLPLVNAAF